MLDKNQETFEKVLDHLGRQKRRAVEGLLCAYKANNGDKCAIGCLIPDKEYRPSFENHVIKDIVNDISTLKDVNLSLLKDLQCLHDNRFFWDKNNSNPNHAFSITGLDKIQDIAHAYNLKVPQAYILPPSLRECANE